MPQLDEKAINHEDLAAYHDQLMQSEMSKKSDKTNTYTKTEVDTKFDEFSGPVYDETDHGFNFPTTAKMTYDSVDHGFVFG